MFWDETASFPEDALKLGHYLVPIMDVCSALIDKILTQNGQVLHTSMNRPLTLDALSDMEGQVVQAQFMACVHEKLGSQVLQGGLGECGDRRIPTAWSSWGHYTERTDLSTAARRIIPTPEVADNYLCVEILLPRGRQVVIGHVVMQKRDANRNAIEKVYANLTLDMRQYQVELTGDMITELTANVIAESMNAQCDVDIKSIYY